MTSEELQKLMNDIAGELQGLGGDPDKLKRAERKRRLVLMARQEALERVKDAKEKDDFNKETKACLDYSLLTEYAEKHPLLYNLVRSQVGWWIRW